MSQPPVPDALPARPALRPGLRVVRRDDRHLQVGVDPPHRLVVRDEPGIRRLLEDLRAGHPVTAPGGAALRCLAALHHHDLLVDAAALDRALLAAEDPAAVAATFAQAGLGAGARLAARARSRVGVVAPADVATTAQALLGASGVAADRDGDPTAVLLVSLVPLCPDRLDPHVRAGRPHLVVTPTARGFRVGPFVVPGRTACVRCVDAHLGELDPRRAVVLEQLGRPPAGGLAPRDPALLSVALAWAVRDVVSFLDGDEPATWSASVDLGPDLAAERRAWRRHPHCGCAWGDLRAG
jgi:hypothetical protein